jgi:hypothetical protein
LSSIGNAATRDAANATTSKRSFDDRISKKFFKTKKKMELFSI